MPPLRPPPPAAADLASTPSPADTDAEVFALLDRSRTAHTGPTVAAVNALRRLGKDRALRLLEQYAQRDDDTRDAGRVWDRCDAVIFLCRLLFVPPAGGWDRFSLGVLPWGLDAELAYREFPQFPFAVSEDVPVLLIEATALLGATHQPEPPSATQGPFG
jgi:hypothetical protein